MKYNISQYSV